MSQHQIGVATPLRPIQVATSKRGRDTIFSYQAPGQVATPKLGRDPSWRLTYVATSFSCRDLAPAHNGIFRSRRQTPGRDLPHCYPCHDLKNDVATSRPTKPGRDLIMMSRPQEVLTHNEFFFFQNPPIAFPATPKDAVA